jgi:hypothetical protein
MVLLNNAKKAGHFFLQKIGIDRVKLLIGGGRICKI